MQCNPIGANLIQIYYSIAQHDNIPGSEYASLLQLDVAYWVQAESVNELVGARTAAAADSAIAGLTGGIGNMVQKLRRSALVLLAELEVPLTASCLSPCLRRWPLLLWD